MKRLQKIGLGLTAVVMTSPVLAAPPDLSPLTGAIDLSTVVTAVLAVGVILAGLYAAIKGAKTVLSMVKGG